MKAKQGIKKAKHEIGKAAGWNPMAFLSGIGVRSNHLYIAGLVSIGFSILAWLLSRGKDDAREQSDRWGLFVGEWTPTLFALGVGLKLEEDD